MFPILKLKKYKSCFSFWINKMSICCTWCIVIQSLKVYYSNSKVAISFVFSLKNKERLSIYGTIHYCSHHNNWKNPKFRVKKRSTLKSRTTKFNHDHPITKHIILLSYIYLKNIVNLTHTLILYTLSLDSLWFNFLYNTFLFSSYYFFLLSFG